MSLIAVKAHIDLKDVFLEVVCTNLSEDDDPAQDWERVLVCDGDYNLFVIDASQIIEIHTQP